MCQQAMGEPWELSKQERKQYQVCTLEDELANNIQNSIQEDEESETNPEAPLPKLSSEREGLSLNGASPRTQQVKNLPAMQETQDTWVPSLCQEDPLEKEMATHSTEQLSSHVGA